MRIIFNMLFLLFLLLGCKSEERKGIPPSNKLTLILLKPKINVMMKQSNGSSMGIGKPGEELSVIDGNNVFHQIKINYEPLDDTVFIDENRKLIQVNFVYKVFDQFNFLFHRGDSVVIEYTKGYPSVKILNREVKKWDYNFEHYVREKIYKGDYPSFSKSAFPWRYTNNLKSMDSLQNSFMEISLTEIDNENLLLDSLYRKDLISKVNFDFYKQRNSFWLEILKINKSDQYVRPAWTANDTLLKNQFFKNFITTLAAKKIELGIARVKTTNSNLVDYRIALDKTIPNTDFSDKEKDVLLLHYIEQIVKSFSKTDIEQYLAKFSGAVKNKELITYVTSNYNLDFNSSKELQLKTLAQEKLTFNQILQSHKGKLVYVDFWASWCAPCIASFPDAKILKDEFADKKVTFVYLSIDKDYEPWKNASVKYGLTNVKNYLVDNQYVSDMMESLQVNAIPRYLLYDVKGNLVHKNAPGPKGNEIRKILNKYLLAK